MCSANVSLIIPAAGSSSRFPNMRPKWMLTHPNGSLMINEAISGLKLSSVSKIYVTVLKDHIKAHTTLDKLVQSFHDMGIKKDIKPVVLDSATQSQPETVYQTLKKEKISGAIFIKDTDNFFVHDIKEENAVTVCDLNDLGLINASNKSYVTFNENQIIDNIVEKKIISSFFCTGGYSFKDADTFCRYFEALENTSSLYISHIIFNMLLDNHFFKAAEIKNLEDWGTAEDWNRFKKKYLTLFVDLDGVIVKNSGRYIGNEWGTTQGIEKNIKCLNTLYNTGKVKIIITTSRAAVCSDITKQQLKENGLKYDQIIYDLPHAKRILINDFANSNSYKSCDAINLPRNAETLDEILKGISGT